MNDRKSSLFQIAVSSGMALLLAGVGIMQYKWATELSAATEVRLGSNLQSLMTRWHRDLYDELSAVCIAMQVGPDSGAHDGWNDYLQRYADWNKDRVGDGSGNWGDASTDLVREVYEWRTSMPGKPELLRLNPKAKTLDSLSAAPELQKLLTRLQENSASLDQAMRAWELRSAAERQTVAGNSTGRTSAPRSNALAGWQLDQRIPALVHPVVHHSNPFSSLTPVDRSAVDWFVVVLNSDVIQNRILPELANRHFGGPDGLEYKIAVVATGSERRAIYSSDPELRTEDAGSFDSAMNIFGSSQNISQGKPQEAASGTHSLQEQDWRRFSAPAWFPVIQYSSIAEPWVLLVEHRTGPLGKIARSVWYWDLTIGGIVLILLAANMALVTFTSHRAQKLAKMQMHFVAAVSHELLTPLSAMYCTGQNARDGLVQTKSDLIAHGSIITSQARQLIELVKQNLLFAATESGTKRYTSHPLQVSELVRNVGKDVEILVEESGCTIEYDIPAGLPNVMADLSALTQCLQNLLLNAIKYRGKDGWVGVSASLQETKNGGREVQISVRDHGLGISSSDLRHIFEPFYRSPKVTEAQIHGTGLGLTVADRIARAMGGRLSVTSELGVGSVFTLHLPVGKVSLEMSGSLKQLAQG